MKINKSYFKSKTLWVSLIMAIAPIFPQVQEIIVSKPEVVGMVVGGVFSLLRVATTQPLGKEEKRLK